MTKAEKHQAAQLAHWEATAKQHDAEIAKRKAAGCERVNFDHVAYQKMIYGKGWNA